MGATIEEPFASEKHWKHGIKAWMLYPGLHFNYANL